MDRRGRLAPEDQALIDASGRPEARAGCCGFRREGGIVTAMAQSLRMPPPGFDDLPVEEKIEYVQSLWDRIAVSAGELPLHDWQREILDERLAAHRASPDEAKPWKGVLDGRERRLTAR